VDVVFEVSKKTTKEDVNAALKSAAEGKLRGILQYEEAPLVSIDFKGNPHSSIVDAALTSVMEGTMVKVVSWYDNEWGYSNRLRDLAILVATKGLYLSTRSDRGTQRPAKTFSVPQYLCDGFSGVVKWTKRPSKRST
jgi:hypothetical protein